jgi:hypothetical protein
VKNSPLEVATINDKHMDSIIIPLKNREKILEERRIWYSFVPVQFELVKQLKNRELAFLTQKGEEKKKAVRYLLSERIEYLKKHFEFMHFFESLMNCYLSTAKLNNVPMFSYNLEKRKEDEKYKNFNENYYDFVIGYDMFFDFDGKEDFALCQKECMIVKKVLEEYKVPYYLLNSSFKGFHIIVPAEFMPKFDREKTLREINEVLYNISGIYDLHTLDLSIGDIKRLRKLPYSMVGDGSIALPLSDFQFENFKHEDVTMQKIMRNLTIKNRGLLVRTYFLTPDRLQKNVESFLEDFK